MARMIANSRTHGQRAHVTLCFLDLCDYTAITELNDPEVANAFRRKIERLVAGIVRKHGGVVVQFVGDGSLAVFGLPLPQEDDSRRAVEAALEVHEAARRLRWSGAAPPGFQVRMHSGVHSGLVFVRTGDTLHGQYELTGDAVNLAARLSDEAEHDQILVSGTTLRTVDVFFFTEPARELRLKGKRDLVRVSRVLGRRNAHDRFDARRRSGLTPFVGREQQLASLEDVLEGARQSQGRLAVIKGVAGIGKTRLLDELRIRANHAGVHAVSGICDGYGEVVALHPFLQILRELFGFTPDLAPATAANLACERLAELGIQEHSTTFLRLLSLTEPGSNEARQNVTAIMSLRALAALVERLTAQHPIAVLLDDWQWADENSRSVLRVLCRKFSRQRLCVIVCMREERGFEIGVRPHLIVELSPLSGSECKQALTALRSRDLDSRLTAALIERSGGNPLFLEELCHCLPPDVLAGQIELERSGIPNTLRGLIQAHAARLTKAENQILRLAAVIGVEFGAPTLAHIEGVPVDGILASLAAEGFIYAVGGQSYRFNHGITRDVVYESVRLAERRKLHAAIALALQATAGEHLRDPDHWERLAFHHRGSEQHALAADCAEIAGDKAAATSFVAAARTQYAAALASLDRLNASPELIRRWLAINAKWSEQAAWAPSQSDLVLLERAVSYAALIDDPAAQAHNSHMLGWFYFVSGAASEAISHYLDARDLAEQIGDGKLYTQSLKTLGQAYAARGDNDLALHYLTQSIELKRARPRNAEPGRLPAQYAHALGERAIVLADLGDFEAAEVDLGEALDIVRGTGHAMEPSVLSEHALMLHRRARWAEAAHVANRCANAADRVGSMYVFGLNYGLEHYARYKLKPSPQSFARLHRAVDWLEVNQMRLYISVLYAALADAAVNEGEVSVARDYCERALSRAADGDPHGRISALRTLARLAIMQPDGHVLVDEYLGQAFAFAHVQSSKREVALTSHVATQLGVVLPEHVKALSPAQTLRELERMGMTAYAREAREMLGRISQLSGSSAAHRLAGT